MYIGLDIGTSSTKGVLIESEGRVVATASSAYDFDRPKPGWSEQDPIVWWRAARTVLGELCLQNSREPIKAIGLSGQMHGCVLLDETALRKAGSRDISALRSAIMWNDQRTAEQCGDITARLGSAARLVEITGNAALTGFTLPKLLWVRQHEPELFERVRCMMMPKDFVRLCLTGEPATDVGDAAGTLLFDVERRIWSDVIAKSVSVTPDILPRIHESGAIAGCITPWAAAETGLPAGIPVVAGSGDNQCGGIGAGAVAEGTVVLTLGTSGVVFAHSDSCIRDLDAQSPGRVHTMCSATGNTSLTGAWTITGCMLSAAGSLEWARGVLAPDLPFDVLLAEAGDVAPGCDGLLFMPHLTGERCPHPDPQARGGWIGLSRSHTRAHLVRAVLEGVSFTLAQVFDLVRNLGINASDVRIGGGGAKSALWRQIQADIINQPIMTLATDQGPAHGAALIAATSCSEFSTLAEACSTAVKPATTVLPRETAHQYGAMRDRYQRLYPALADIMKS